MFGIPTSQTIPLDHFQSIKKFFGNIIDSFDIDPMKVHVGLVTYSGTASTALTINQLDSDDVIKEFTNQLSQQGTQVNVASALKEAAHNTFTIFGGVRQSSPKAFVLVVPEGSVNSRQEVLTAAERLKSLGVRLFIVGVGAGIDANLLRLSSSQPYAKFFHNIPDHKTLFIKSRDIAEVVCKGNAIKRVSKLVTGT